MGDILEIILGGQRQTAVFKAVRSFGALRNGILLQMKFWLLTSSVTAAAESFSLKLILTNSPASLLQFCLRF